MIRPVAEWLSFFSHFTDEQILNPGYAIHGSASGGKWCKLCDRAVIGESGEGHLGRHTRDLAAYRRKQRALVADMRIRNLRTRAKAA